MNLQVLKLSECHESETNPRGAIVADKAFADLVASVKEKGVLVPILIRKDEKGYEVIAGNRRYRAAMQAGLKEIPAHVVVMTDDEAREAQIVENLQRQDIHPLEEGDAYRQLIEEGGRKIADVAIKVGKSESYVRQRLFLTNLSEKAKKLYRNDEWPDTLMVLVAKLSPKNQDALVDDIGGRNYDAADLKEYIDEHFSNALNNQPWLKSAEIAKVVGPCKECPPNRAVLFGNMKDGQCVDLKCWTRKMKAYVAWIAKENPEILLVSSHYGKPEAVDVLSHSQYEAVGKKACDFVTKAVITDGEEIGKIISICADKACKEHRGGDSEYAPTEKEKAKRKKEREQDEARRAKFDEAVAKALLNVKWPLSDKHLDALFALLLDGASSNTTQPLLKRHSLKAEVRKRDGYSERDFRSPLRKLAEADGKNGKLRMIFELLLPMYWSHGDDKEILKKVAKL